MKFLGKLAGYNPNYAYLRWMRKTAQDSLTAGLCAKALGVPLDEIKNLYRCRELLQQLLERSAENTVYTDVHGNEWQKRGADIIYEFEPEVPPRRRRWPPKLEHLKTAENTIAKVAGRKFRVRPTDVQIDRVGNKYRLRVESVPAFEKSGLETFVSRATVFFDFRGSVTQIHPKHVVVFPDTLSKYSKIIHRERKRFRRDLLKGHFRPGYYVRFGKWSGVSRFGLAAGGSYENPDGWDETGKKFEAGLSVYGARRVRGRWILDDIDRRAATYNISDYWDHMLSGPLKGRPIYLVRGTPVAALNPENPNKPYLILGSDGEPLLNPDTVKKIRKLHPEEVALTPGGKSIAERWK